MDQSHGRGSAAARLSARREVVLEGPDFPRPEHPPGARIFLRLEGLETPSEISLNGEVILDARNFFRTYRLEVTGRLAEANRLEVRCPPLPSVPVPRKPRARWRTALAQPAELRWHRTSLLGRMPGWNPGRPARPWRSAALEIDFPVHVESLQVRARLHGDAADLHVRARVEGCGATSLTGARLCLGGHAVHLPLVSGAIDARVPVDDPPRWWPHTHGEPRLVPWRLEILAGRSWVSVGEGRAGFREITVDETGGDFAIAVNGVAVFCRGSCWAPVDFERIHASPEATRTALEQLRAAGANMVRVGGTMAYESDAFHEACDALGLLVWQDFMFANFDYPFADPAFRAEAEAECREHAARLVRHPSTAVLCGGSEVAQQAAMMGLESRHWLDPFFTETIPAILRDAGSDLPYVPSTPWGGALPFHVGTGVSHYYGVGAYRRPLADAKTANVRFAAECLAFANLGSGLGSDPTTSDTGPVAGTVGSDPRIPRDPNASWDFADVRDFYLRELFGVDPVALRSQDVERYLALSRVVPGEVMRRTYAEWRSTGSGCRGALTWLWRDVMPGAGWGVIDVRGNPKPAYWALKRAWAPVAIHLTDEGLDGYAVHVVNERAARFGGRVVVQLLRHGSVVTESRAFEVEVPAHGAITLQVDALVGHFTDATNAYRFGPAKYDVVAAVLEDASGAALSEDFAFPLGWNLERAPGTLSVNCEADAIVIETDRFLQAVRIDAEGWQPEDDFFHLRPGAPRRVAMRCLTPGSPLQVRVSALNAASEACAEFASNGSRKVNA